MRRFDIDAIEEDGMPYHELAAQQRRAQARQYTTIMEDFALDDKDIPPLPWGRAFGIACLIVAGLILCYAAYNN